MTDFQNKSIGGSLYESPILFYLHKDKKASKEKTSLLALK